MKYIQVRASDPPCLKRFDKRRLINGIAAPDIYNYAISRQFGDKFSVNEIIRPRITRQSQNKPSRFFKRRVKFIEILTPKALDLDA